MEPEARGGSVELVAYLRDLPHEELIAWCDIRRGRVTQEHARPAVVSDIPDVPIAEPPKLERPELDPPLTRVSDREREVLRLTTLGLSRAQIGNALYISPRTVSAHVYSARRKLLRMPPGALALTIDQ